MLASENAGHDAYTLDEQSQTAGELGPLLVAAGLIVEPGYSEFTAAVSVDLPAGSESFADSLIGRFGDRVAIAVAGRPYLPPGCGAMPWGGYCPTLDPVPNASADLSARLDLPATDFRQDEVLRGSLVVENRGPLRLAMYGSGSGMAPTVYDPSRPSIIGMFSGAMTADLHTYALEPGASVSIAVTLSGVRCGGSNGENSLPPGTYRVRATATFVAPIDLAASSATDAFNQPILASVTAEATVHVVAR